jgi:alanyl-tRNA synthetase
MIVGVPEDRPIVVIAVNEAGRKAGLAAGKLVGAAAKALGGGGGGKPDVAQGGGSAGAGASEINAAFDSVRAALRGR